MHFPLSPVVAAILAATIPAFPTMVSAAPTAPIVVDDPLGNTSLLLFPGWNVTVNTGEAIRVDGSGNSVEASGVSLIGEADGRGAHAQGGGTILLTDSTVQTQDGTALSASEANSLVSATNSQLSSMATTVRAVDGARIELNGTNVSGAGGFGATMHASGGHITAKNLEITSVARNEIESYAVRAQSGGHVELTDVIVSSVDESGTARTALISVQDADFTMTNSHTKTGIVQSAASSLHVSGNSVATVTGSVIEGAITGSDGATLNVVDTVLGGPNGVFIGVYLLGNSTATASLDNVTIGSEAVAVTDGVVARANHVINAKDVDIHASRFGIRTVNGSAQVQGGTLRAGQAGLYALSEDDTAPSTIVAVGTHVLAEATNAVGASAAQRGAHVSLDGVTVDVSGTGGTALRVTDGAHIDAVNSELYGQSTNSTGVQLLGSIDAGETAASLSGTQVLMTGQNANGVQSVRYEPQGANSVVLADGSNLQTHDGVGFLVRGGDHDITVQNATVMARAGGDESSGILLRTQATPNAGIVPGQPYETQRVTLNATGALMTGDVLTSDSGRVDIDLAIGSEWTGAVRAGQGSVDSVSIDGSSVWNVRGDSAVKTLTNAGVVRFVSPGAQSGFKTLTVSDYIGGGTLVMNTQLGDDTSPTDRLVVDGGAVTGTTGLRVLNAGGAGALTTQGIRLVQATNGATISGNAFYLDEDSTGYRPSTISLGLNGYDYFLVQGGTGGVASDWYLTSTTPPEEGGATDPGGQTPPGSGTETPPGSGGGATGSAPGMLQNVSPENGAHIGNQVAATRMFVHRLADRTVAQTAAGQSAPGSASRQVWARTEGARHTGMKLNEGQVSIDTDTAMLQMGADLVSMRLGQQGVLKAGVMAGAGDARTHATSQLIHPGTGMALRADARGKVSGYSAGIYATAYADDATRLGAYADSWLQFGRYSNEINSELGSARYRSNTWTASVEAGYALKPFAADSALGAMVVVPQAQLAYTRYNAQDAVLPSMTLKNSPASSVTSRVGVRAYPLGNDAATSPVRPYVEANWLHNSGSAKANVGASTFHATPMRDAAELRIGVTGNVRESWQVSGELFGQAGNGGQRGYGGMLNVGYRW
ncbi:autotransporter outer membrane beta-barrel domain-containing protein [Achromobacter mucicolens]|uniref:autotransporter outer membrane beta-barrel domain-containing protein n=1 Tax=Achromobacter mucicolens TaxID=1389922 RepID=UPI00244B1991|nr:autotransporter outer membrane beta-barrel domain-containing protein [Achromobacter mucicolens]MDH0093218.1 autotransporter outer membrane beta-barrel domain-containing protein [Achromobacter mucicolens]